MARILMTGDALVFNEGKKNEFTIEPGVTVTERGGDRSVRGGILLWDLDKRQQNREHTVHPPGQECYLRPIDKDLLGRTLADFGSTATVEQVLNATVGAGDVSLTTIKTAADLSDDSPLGLSADEKAQIIQDILSIQLVETGNFLLSLHGGVLSKLKETTDGSGNPAILILTDEGDAPFQL